MTRELVITLQEWQICETEDILASLKSIGIDDVTIRDIDEDSNDS